MAAKIIDGTCAFGSLGGFGIPGLGLIVQALIFVLFFLIVYWVLKGNKNSESALDILKKRLAKGEISAREFSELKKEIV